MKAVKFTVALYFCGAVLWHLLLIAFASIRDSSFYFDIAGLLMNPITVLFVLHDGLILGKEKLHESIVCMGIAYFSVLLVFYFRFRSREPVLPSTIQRKAKHKG